MKTPIIYKLDIFVLTQEILDREYVIFSQIPFSDTVSFLIDDSNTILQNRYEIIKVIDTNISIFSNASIGEYVLSWKNSDAELKNLLQSKLNQKISVQYVNYEIVDEIEQNKEDHINWEIL